MLAVLVLMLLFPAAAHAAPWSFPSAPTDQLAVPGEAAGAEVTPEGRLYTGHSELVYRAGPRLAAFRQPRRAFVEGRYPVVLATREVAGVRYRVEQFMAPVPGAGAAAFVRVEATNGTARRTRATFAADLAWAAAARQGNGLYTSRYERPVTGRPPGLYLQPGLPFDPAARYSVAGRAIMRDGLALAVLRPPARGVTQSLRADPPAEPVTPATAVARAATQATLSPGASVTLLEAAVPARALAPGAALDALAAADPAAARARVLRQWRRFLGRALRVRMPERLVEDAWASSLVTAAMSRYRLPGGDWVQPVNKLQYHSFWLRDASLISRTFDLVGLHDIAAENLRFFLRWQRPDGLFISREGQLDGFGQAPWAFAEHARRARDPAFARAVLPAVARAMDWLAAHRARDPSGLMPAATVTDNELTTGRIAGDNLWALAGTRGAVQLARLAGDEARATQWQALHDALRADVARAVAAAAARTPHGAIPPALDHAGGEDFGNLSFHHPTEAWPVSSREATGTIARARRRFREGLATYRLGGRTLVHGSLGFRIWQAELARGEQRPVVQGLYDSLAHTTATLGGFEMLNGRRTGDNLTPNGWWSSELVSLLRSMLVREEGDDLVLLSAIPPGWLRGRRPLTVRGAPTLAGPVSFTLRPRPGGAELSWEAGVAAGTRLRWPVPAWARAVRSAALSRDGRDLVLAGRRGRLRVRWRLTPAAQDPSYARSVARLRARYADGDTGDDGNTLPGDA